MEKSPWALGTRSPWALGLYGHSLARHSVARHSVAWALSCWALSRTPLFTRMEAGLFFIFHKTLIMTDVLKLRYYCKK